MEYKRADRKNPLMGLDNKTCSSPDYWRRLHQVWLSERALRERNAREG